MKSLGNGKYEITNKKTGQTKVVSQQELPQYGITPPADTRGGGRQLLDVLSSGASEAVINAPQRAKESPYKPTSVIDALNPISAAQDFKHQVVDPTFMPAAKNVFWYRAFPGMLSGLKNFVTGKTAQTIGKGLETKAIQAGQVPNDILLKKLGTSSAPNPKLYEGIATPGKQAEVLKLLKKEIANIGKGTGKEIKGPSYKNLFDWKKAYQNTARYGTKTQGPIESQTSKRLARSMKEILDEIPGWQAQNRMYRLASAPENTSRLVGKYAPPAAVGAGTAGVTSLLLYNLFGRNK